MKDYRPAWLGLVLAFALWPAIQIRLSHTDWVSPWKLMGFGMYATIPPRHTVRLIEVRGEREVRLPGIPGKVLGQHKRYSRLRASLGGLADPTALGHTFLAARPNLDAVLVEVDVTALEASSARVVLVRRDRYRFVRGARAKAARPD